MELILKQKDYNKKFKIIAETAFSHEGDFAYLIQQIDAVEKSKADYIKFQVFLNKEDYIVPQHPSYALVDKWMFTEAEWVRAFEYALIKNIKIIVLPLNVSSLEFCIQNEDKIDLFEIHSVCFNDIPLLNKFKSIRKKIILGIGGRTDLEIENIINKLQKPLSDLILMFGFQSFPTNKAILNLKKIRNFKNRFNCSMAYADHSAFDNNDHLELNALAYCLGAEYFEKHIVLKKGFSRIDYESGVEADDISLMKEKLAQIEKILGNGQLNVLNDKELLYKNREKQMVYAENLKKGHIISPEDIVYKITETYSDFHELRKDTILNKTLIINVKQSQSIMNTHLA